MKPNSSLLSFLLLLAASVSLISTASVVFAQTDAAEAPEPEMSARDHFVAGQAAYDNGAYEEAIRHFSAAHGLDPRPALLYNLAQAHGRLGHAQQEARFLERFIGEAHSTDAELLASARSRLSTLRDRLARTGVTLSGAPEGALVRIDGEERGRAPLEASLSLDPGNHEVVVEHDGYETFRAAVSVNAGQTVHVEAEMVEDTSPGVPTSAIALWAGGGGAIVAGAAIGGIALSQSSGTADGTARADRARRLARSADVLMAVGAAAAVTGLVLYLVGRGSDDDDEEATSFYVAPQVAPTQVGAAVGGQF